MPFDIRTTPLPGVLVIQPQVFHDPRGFFLELFQEQALAEAGFAERFVQDNLSGSTYGTVRGLHFQAPPHAQAKLVTVLHGAVLDVVVDIRRGSPTYGQHWAIELTDANRTVFFIPEGFAHGFSVLSETCLFFYKCSRNYNRPAEGGVFWADPALAIDWLIREPLVSDKDKAQPSLGDIVTPFSFAG
jgi:dTDP-4-dehydrorhamnose 3,5-epimerase